MAIRVSGTTQQRERIAGGNVSNKFFVSTFTLPDT